MTSNITILSAFYGERCRHIKFRLDSDGSTHSLDTDGDSMALWSVDTSELRSVTREEVVALLRQAEPSLDWLLFTTMWQAWHDGYDAGYRARRELTN